MCGRGQWSLDLQGTEPVGMRADPPSTTGEWYGLWASLLSHHEYPGVSVYRHLRGLLCSGGHTHPGFACLRSKLLGGLMLGGVVRLLTPGLGILGSNPGSAAS